MMQRAVIVRTYFLFFMFVHVPICHEKDHEPLDTSVIIAIGVQLTCIVIKYHAD